MNFNFIYSTLMLFLLISFSGIRELKAQSGQEGEEARKLEETIFHHDSLFWEAYNRCDLATMSSFFWEDLEFYHDKGGLTKSLKTLMESTKKGMCGNENWRLRREQVNGSLRLYPLFENGNLYGAILSGEHIFFINETGKEEYLDGIARFTHVWLLEEGAWKMSRVLSYDHRPAGFNPNQEKETALSDGYLMQFAGDYEGAEKRIITLSRQGQTLMLEGGRFRATLYPATENSFYMKERNVGFEFIKDDQQQVLRMLVRENGEIVEAAEKIKKMPKE